MAAADRDQTRFAFLTGVQIPAQRHAAPALRMIPRRAGPRVVANVTDRVVERG